MDEDKHLLTRRTNYKEMHRGTAQNKGVLREFLMAPTLTEMRKVLWGEKKRMKKRRINASNDDGIRS